MKTKVFTANDEVAWDVWVRVEHDRCKAQNTFLDILEIRTFCREEQCRLTSEGKPPLICTITYEILDALPRVETQTEPPACTEAHDPFQYPFGHKRGDPLD